MSQIWTPTGTDSRPASRLSTLPWDDYDPATDSWNVDYWLEPGRLTLGWGAIAWAEGILRQPNGPRAKQPFRMTPGQKRFLLWFYSLDEGGQFLFHHAVRRLSKGSGKSPFAGCVALVEFCGPVRLDKILDPEHPEPPKRLTGRPVDMPWVQIVATAEKQGHNTMRHVRAFAPKKSPVVTEYGLDPGITQYYRSADEGKLEIITSSMTTAEGAEPTFVVADETEHWKPENGGPDLMATIADNLAKSSGAARMLETCNAWIPGIESVAEASYLAWEAQEEGRTRTESRILYDARRAPPSTDLHDPASLKAGLEFVYRDCSWKKPHLTTGNQVIPLREAPPDVRSIMNRIYDVRSRPDDSKRKYLNWPTAAKDSWLLDLEAWDLLENPREVPPDEAVALFFDGSKTRDSTALVGCTVESGYVFEVDVWERPIGAAGENWQVPVEEVDAKVEWAFDHLDVVAFYADVKEWESFVYTTWPGRYKSRLFLWALKTGKNAAPIAWDMRNRVSDFTLAAEACLSEIMGGEFEHDGSTVIGRHIANARAHPNRYGVSISKASPDSPRKIDAAVCVIGARMVRRHVLASPEWAKRKRKTGRAAFL